MSDYLWDKTGEPDAETERLENLLGQLRFQQTPFDLPAELPAKEFRAARTRNVLSWPRLAVAASIALAALAGAWLALRQQTGATNDAPRVVQQNKQTDAGQDQSAAAAPKATGAASDKNEGGEKKMNETPAAIQPQADEPGRGELAGGRPRPRLPDLDKNASRRLPRAAGTRANEATAAAARRQKNLAMPPRVEPARREETARLAAEREAAEKVLYALRVTSEKLNYARQQVQVSGRGEDNR